MADPPCQAALTRVIGRENDGEMRGNLQIFRDDLYAAIRNIRNCTVTWQRTRAALDPGDPLAHPSFAPASIRIHVVRDPPLLVLFIGQPSGEVFE